MRTPRCIGRISERAISHVKTSPPGHGAYLVPTKGSVIINGVRVESREGSLRDETAIEVMAVSDAELVLVIAGPVPQSAT